MAIAARWIARTEIEAGQLIALPLPKAKLKRRWIVSTLKDRPLNLPERTFIGLCEEVRRRIVVNSSHQPEYRSNFLKSAIA